MSGFSQDLRYAVRNLLRSPGFTAVALASLALGIGANTAIFSITDQVLLRLLPVRHARELLFFNTSGANFGTIAGPNAFSYPMYRDLSASTDLLAGVAGRFPTPASLAYRGRSDRVTAELVTGNYFDVLGLGVAVGRGIAPEDDRVPGAHPVVVLTHRYWMTRFGANPGVLNQTVTVNAQPMTVIGVAAPGYDGYGTGERVDLLVPVMMKARMTPTWNGLDDRRVMWLQLVGRLRPGASRERAQTMLRARYHAVLMSELEAIPNAPLRLRRGFETKPFRLTAGWRGTDEMREEFTAPLVLLSAMVGLLLLIACANVANLLLARAAGRRREIAVRLALGAGRPRLVRQLVVESLVLALAGGALGLLVAAWTGAWLGRLLADTSSIVFESSPDLRVLGFTAALSLLTGLLFGLAPALQATRAALAGTLKDQAGSVSPGAAHMRTRKLLVVAQVALSLVLLIGATLFVRSLANLRNLNLGFRRDHLIVFTVDPALNGYSQARLKRFAVDLQERLATVSGVRSVGIGETLLLDDNQNLSTIFIPGRVPKEGEDMNPEVNGVSPGYFSTLGHPLLLGREFAAADTANSPRAVIVNEAFVRQFFPDSNPLGRQMGFRRTSTTYEIVGVVKDSRYGSVKDKPPRIVYLPLQQQQDPTVLTVYSRTSGDQAGAMNALRRTVASMDPMLPVTNLRTMDEQVDRALASERLISSLALAFGVLATILSAVGLYGVMAYTVGRRTREIGIRVALGAQASTLIAMVMREVVGLTAAGMLIAIPCAVWLASLARGQLYGVAPEDPASVAAATALLGLVAVAAGWLPARRATRIEPVQALRYE